MPGTAFLPTNHHQFLPLMNSIFFFFIFRISKIARTHHGALKVKGKTFRPSQTRRGYPSVMESDEESARRRHQRFWEPRFSERVCQRQKLEMRGRNEDEVFRRRREFQFFELHRELVFLFGFFPGGDGLAKRTGILAVKRSASAVLNGALCRIAHNHPRPRHRLQRSPMRIVAASSATIRKILPTHFNTYGA